jgi:hypothetical protein
MEWWDPVIECSEDPNNLQELVSFSQNSSASIKIYSGRWLCELVEAEEQIKATFIKMSDELKQKIWVAVGPGQREYNWVVL